MKKLSKLILPLAIIAVIATGCDKKDNSHVKTAHLTFKVTTQKDGTKSSSTQKGLNFAVKGGTLSVSDATLGFENVYVMADNIDSLDYQEVELPGPFVYNLSSSPITIGEANFPPGTYSKVVLSFVPLNKSQLRGNSMVIKGTYTPTGGKAIPFVLESKFSETLLFDLANPIEVKTNSKASVTIIFKIKSWLNQLEFNKAVQKDGSIIINLSHNSQLYYHFEAALTGADFHWDDNNGGSGSGSGDSTGVIYPSRH